MAHVKPPESLDFSKPQQWLEWKRRFSRYRIASKLFKDDPEIQVTLSFTVWARKANIFMVSSD